jgi:hypothetical protein
MNALPLRNLDSAGGRCLMLALAIIAVAEGLLAESKEPAGAPESDPRAKEREERLADMRVLAGRLSFEEPGDDGAPRRLVVEQPLLHYTDADRGIFDGTLWAYGREGRPVVILEMYGGPESNPRYRHATTATSDRPLKMVGAPGIEWTPRGSAITWAPLKSDLAPAAEAGARLRQFKALVKRFSVYQIFEPAAQREELRLLVQPLHRYSDNDQRIRDGILFAYALGTNPEALLFLEARDDRSGGLAWHFGFARRGSMAAVHGLLDGQEVWGVPRLVTVKPDDPHVHFYRTLTGDPDLGDP